MKGKKVKSIITKSNLPYADFVLNPYTGCQHACLYCYADFNILRKLILIKLFNSNHSENFNAVKQRFLDFLDYVSSSEYDSILCITHGWFMRLIYIYSMKISLDSVSLDELLRAKVPSFLDMIEISLK